MQFDLYNNVLPTRALQIQTITGSPLNTGDVDLAGYYSAQVVVDFGDIDEMGTSPVGSAKIDIKLEHADDDGTGAAGAYANVAAADIDGLTPSSGVVATVTTDANEVVFGYVGSRRFVRVTLTPTALTIGGPVGVWAMDGHAHLAPVTQG